MGRSLQLLDKVGSPQFSKCVSRPSSSLSSSAPSLWTRTSIRKSVRRNVVASLRDSAHTTGLDTLQGTGPAMTGTTATTPARAEPTTTTRGSPRLTQTPSTVTTAMVLGTPMAMVLGTLMEMASATPMGIFWHMLMAPTVTDLDMVWATFTDPPVVPFTNT